MTRLLGVGIVALGVAAATGALAGERTVTLAVENMSCVACSYIVQESLSRVPGVIDVATSLEAGTATVAYDDAKVTIPDLIAATADIGYPSTPTE